LEEYILSLKDTYDDTVLNQTIDLMEHELIRTPKNSSKFLSILMSHLYLLFLVPATFQVGLRLQWYLPPKVDVRRHSLLFSTHLVTK